MLSVRYCLYVLSYLTPHPPRSTLFPYTTLFRSRRRRRARPRDGARGLRSRRPLRAGPRGLRDAPPQSAGVERRGRSEEHTSELQSHVNLVCRLLLEKKKAKKVSSTVLQTELLTP